MNSIRVWPKILVLQQSLFGLPWLVASLFLPCLLQEKVSSNMMSWAFLFIAFFSARFAGMSLNSLIDHFYDKKNARTAERPLPRGDISRTEVLLGSVLFLLLFCISAYAINSKSILPACGISLLLLLYSYMKRITYLCHFVLGSIHGLVPLCVYACETNTFSMAPLLFGASLGFSIAANDIIYACQDEAFDRETGLYSIPACFGKERALRIAQASHAASVLFLVGFGMYCHLSLLYFGWCVGLGTLFVMSYKKLKRESLFVVFSWSNRLAALVVFAAIFCEYVYK